MLTISTWRRTSLRVIPIVAFFFTAGSAHAQILDLPDDHAARARPPAHSFGGGFLSVVESSDPKTRAIIGDPVEDEHPIGGDYQIQFTTGGVMLWKPGIPAQFFDGYHRFAVDDYGEMVTWDGDDEDIPKPTYVAASVSTKSLSSPAVASPTAAPAYGIWDALAQCEASGNWANTANRVYSGGLQMDSTFWAKYGGLAYASTPARATRAQQIAVAQRGLAVQGPGAWPVCSRVVGLR